VGEWMFDVVAVWKGWYVQGSCRDMNLGHTDTHTPRREFKGSKYV
jgi:hypothetical protein